MSPVPQLPQFGKSPEVLLDTIKVNGAISVVVGNRRPPVLLAFVKVVYVVVNRSHPDCGHAKALDVIEMVDDALQIAAVVVAALRPVVESTGLCSLIFCLIAVAQPTPPH